MTHKLNHFEKTVKIKSWIEVAEWSPAKAFEGFW